MKRLVLISLAVILLLFAGAAIYAYTQIGRANTAFSEPSKLLYVPSSFEMDELVERLLEENIIASVKNFQLVAQLKKFHTPKPGKYRIKKGMSNNALVNLLRSGNQEPVLIRLDDLRTVEELAGRLAKSTEIDSASYLDHFLNPKFLSDRQLTARTMVSLIIADTYDFFWTLSPEEFTTRMGEIHNQYWTRERLQKAQAIGLSPTEVYTLASIVKGETARKDEAPIIAGLYLNRLRKGMRLESDPTVIFANGNFGSQRVLYSDLSTASPYNTYQNAGLPPGPISLCEKTYLDAVLDAENHDYLFMCAQPGGTGKHSFAVSYEQHLQYAKEYRTWLDEANIRR
jgi:UPF0755 protein